MHNPSSGAVTAFAPLRLPVFRALFIATSVSNVGTWMQEVGRAWLMTELTVSPLYVALVQAAAMVALVAFSIPAGVIADAYNVKRVLLASQLWLMLVALTLAILTMLGGMTPTLLVGLSFAAAAGAAFFGPAWQAALPSLTGQEMLPAAVTLNGLSYNIARSIGPAIGGAVVSLAGPSAVFFINILSFAAVAAALLLWTPPQRPSLVVPQTMASALGDGFRFLRASDAFRAVALRTIAFVLPASALWALLPLLARMSGGASDYGVLLTLVGAGAVASALMLPTLRAHAGDNILTVIAGMILALAFGFMAVGGMSVLYLAMLAAGLGWLGSLTILMVAAQAIVPDWIRGRAMAIYLMAFSAAMAAGSVLWGMVAEAHGVLTAMAAAGAFQALAAVMSVRWRLPVSGDPRATTVPHQWPEPILATSPDYGRGPVLITITYDVVPEHSDGFLRAMQTLGPLRRLEGSSDWMLFKSGRQPAQFIEINVLQSWGDHLRQRARGSAAADIIEKEINRALVPGTDPKVEHWFDA